MKTTMKKTAAYLLAILLVLQMLPAFAEESIISKPQGPITSFREKLEIENHSGNYLLVNQEIQLSVTEGYDVTWKSQDPEIAEVDENGIVKAINAGETVIIAKEGTNTAKESITVINPFQRYTVTYVVNYPNNAVVQLYPDIAPSRPTNNTFTVQTPPVSSGDVSSYVLDNGDYNTDNYKMTGWQADDGTVYAKGETVMVSGNMKFTAVFESEFEGGATKGKSRFLATDNGTTYFTTGASDNNAPEEYKNEKWKFLSVYCYPTEDENGNAMYTFRLPEATREVRNEGEGYNLNSENGAAEKTFIGYRLLKILGVDDISAYTDQVYGISEQVTLPRSTTADGYYFAPVFEEGQTGEAQVRITYNGKTTYIAQGKLSEAGMAALAGSDWAGKTWQNKEASIGGDKNTAVNNEYLEDVPTVKSILRAFGMAAENPDNWIVTWYKIANSNTGFYIVGNLVKNKTRAEEKTSMVIVVNGQKGKLVYNGEEQSYSEFIATSNNEEFDADKVRVVKDFSVSRKDCGIVSMVLDPSDFAYDDPNVEASFVVSNGWLKIVPATVTVRLADNIEKLWGQDDPDYSEYLIFDGLYGDDKIDAKVTRQEGEGAATYRLTLSGEQAKDSNYKVVFNDGHMEIVMPPVTVKSSLEGVTEAPIGTEVTMTAEMDGLDTEHYHIQWQMGDTADISQMKDIEGANDISYTYILTEETAGKFFRVVVTLR